MKLNHNEEDNAIKAAKNTEREKERRPGETDEEYQIRMEKMLRRKMTGAEVMERDALLAKAERERRLENEPFPRAEVVAVRSQDGGPNNLQVIISFDRTHPLAPNKGGELILHGSAVFQAYKEDDELRTRRLQQPEKGMIGSLRSIRDMRDGITMHWQFVADVA